MTDENHDDQPDTSTEPASSALSEKIATTATLLAPARFDAGPNTECIDVDADGVETHDVGRRKIDCVKCPGDKPRWHDCFVELEGDQVIVATAMRVCCDCLLETQGTARPVGKIEAPGLLEQNRLAREGMAAHEAIANRAGRRKAESIARKAKQGG